MPEQPTKPDPNDPNPFPPEPQVPCIEAPIDLIAEVTGFADHEAQQHPLHPVEDAPEDD